ncbi:MAG: HD domain-containing protein [Balneolaceae bacterium]|nr:HD domain-containing protein [Balneolaceae bacterium]
MIPRADAEELLNSFIENDALRHHCQMVATAMEAYANHLSKSNTEIEEWWIAGLLHDIDWEKHPDEHPNYAIEHIFPMYDISESVVEAIKAHAPERTGKSPLTEIERYLFACDELSGFMHAVSLMRPTGFEGMKPKSVNKKLKTANFAANVSREDINKGAELINKPLNEHIQFLIEIFESK